MQRYIDSISSFTRPDLRSDLRARPRVISIPYLALSSLLCSTAVRSYLMYGTPPRRRRRSGPNTSVARLVFGTDHSPLSWRGSGSVLGPRREKRYTWSTFPLSLSSFSSAIRIRAAHEENFPVMVPRGGRRERKRRDETARREENEISSSSSLTSSTSPLPPRKRDSERDYGRC